MSNSRRPKRNTGKTIAEEYDNPWDCSSEEEDSEGEHEFVGSQDNVSASNRSSVKCVASVVARFDEKKKELVRSIGFGGILELPQINKVSRRFTLWLLSRLDTESRTIVVNGEPVADMVDFDVKEILGIPAGRLEVRGLSTDDARAKKCFMQQMIGAGANESNSLLAAGRIVKKDYSSRMTKKQCDNFKVSFVVFVVGHLLAPTNRNNIGNSSFWGALTEPDKISQYNWSEYVLQHLVEAASKVQEDIAMKKKISNITGCSILLQVIYFESLRIPGLECPKKVYPKIKVYTCSYLRSLIEADKASTSSGHTSTWGSNVGRPAPPVAGRMTSDERDLVMKLGRSGHFGKELATFAKNNFSGKLNESHANALMVYGERCNDHFNKFKTKIMKENLFLVELLMTGSHCEPKQNIPRAPRSKSYDGAASAGRAKVVRGYESSTEGTENRKRKSPRLRHQFGNVNFPGLDSDTVSTGQLPVEEINEEMTDVNVGAPTINTDLGLNLQENLLDATKNQVSGSAGVNPVVNSAFHNNTISNPDESVFAGSVGLAGSIDPPSFDLGIDFQTQEKYMEAIRKQPVTEQLEVAAGLPFTALGTPVAGKRKANTLSWTTPDERFKSSTTSPASMSKLLAGGVVFARMVCSEDEIDVNVQPWENDTTDSPVTKQALEASRMSKSPWFHGYHHMCYAIEIAGTIFQEAFNATVEDLSRPWVIHRSPRYLEVSGSSIMKCFTLSEGMSYDVYDLAVRCMIQLDGKMYDQANDKRWRHIMESDFAMLAQADEKPCFHKSIREQFFGPSITYKMNRCRMIVMPAQVLMNWCCYFWDFKKKCIHIVDPLYKEVDSAFFKQLHGPIVDKIAAELANCIDLFFSNWTPDWNEWSKEYVPAVVEAENSKESGLLSLLSIREFDGDGFRKMSRESYLEFRMVLLAELLSMEGNKAKPPINLVEEKQVEKIVHNLDD